MTAKLYLDNATMTVRTQDQLDSEVADLASQLLNLTEDDIASIESDFEDMDYQTLENMAYDLFSDCTRHEFD